MKRSEFLQKLLTVLGIAFIPFSGFSKTRRTWLLKFGVRGFSYYKGPELMDEMRVGEKLTLFREPENKFDKRAIAIYYREQKIGFVPREKNEVLSRLMDSGTSQLSAEIIQIRDDKVSWNEVSAGIYLMSVNQLAA